MRIFGYEGIYTRVMGRVFDLVILHLMWVACSLPIVTIGASTTALYTVTLKMANARDGYIVKGFWKAFCENLKQSTILWLFMGALIGVLVFMIRICLKAGTPAFKMIGLCDTVLLFFTAAGLLYLFPIAAYYENTWTKHIRNAFICSMKFLPYTLLMVLILAGIYFLACISGVSFAIVLAVMIACGSSLIALAFSFLFKRIFGVLTPDVQP